MTGCVLWGFLQAELAALNCDNHLLKVMLSQLNQILLHLADLQDWGFFAAEIWNNCRWDTLKCGQMRGNAGSHDLQLGIQTLKALCSLTSSGLPPYPSASICLLFSFGLHLVLPSVVFNPTTAIEMNTSLFLKWINTYLLTVHLAEADYYIMCLAGMTAKLPHYDKVGYLCLHWQPVDLTILDKNLFLCDSQDRRSRTKSMGMWVNR